MGAVAVMATLPLYFKPIRSRRLNTGLQAMGILYPSSFMVPWVQSTTTRVAAFITTGIHDSIVRWKHGWYNGFAFITTGIHDSIVRWKHGWYNGFAFIPQGFTIALSGRNMVLISSYFNHRDSRSYCPVETDLSYFNHRASRSHCPVETWLVSHKQEVEKPCRSLYLHVYTLWINLLSNTVCVL